VSGGGGVVVSDGGGTTESVSGGGAGGGGFESTAVGLSEASSEGPSAQAWKGVVRSITKSASSRIAARAEEWIFILSFALGVGARDGTVAMHFSPHPGRMSRVWPIKTRKTA
jgi:hypothetical protein